MLAFQELKKLVGNRSFVLYLLLLFLVNLFLIWFFSRPNIYNPPQSAYREIAEDMQGMSMEEKGEFLSSSFDYTEAMFILENLYLTELNSGANDQYFEGQLEVHAEIVDKYAQSYAEGPILRYTESVAAEYAFVNAIYKEFLQVNDYDKFLSEIQDAANSLSAISIFADEEGYDHKNIVTTQEAYDKMSDVEISYHPQKGIVTATTFVATDIVMLFAMVLISFMLIQKEKEVGLFRLIRSTSRGRFSTAMAKLIALCVALLGVVVILYGANLLFCNAVFGIGDLSRSVQSVPDLMRSTLGINLLEYILAFLATKWIAALICGLGILLSMLFTKKLISGILLSFAVPGIFFALRVSISAVGELNFFRYANIISYLQTDEILGTYRNLHWFGGVIPMITAQIASAMVYCAILLAIYFVVFTKGQFSFGQSSMLYLPRFRKFRLTSVPRTEWRKVLLLNGGIVVLLLGIGYHAYNVATYIEYLTPEEVVYRDYMQKFSGTYDEEKHELLLSEKDRFSEFEEMERKLRIGEINQQQYNHFANMNYEMSMQYKVYKDVVMMAEYIKGNIGAQFLYDLGYRQLFGLDNDGEYGDSFYYAVISVLMTVATLGGYFSIERSSGVRRILYSTPLGREKTVVTKLINSAVLCVVIALVNTVPSIINVARFHGMSGLFFNAKSIPEYSWIPVFVTTGTVILLQFILRLLAIAFVAAVTLAISQHFDSYITVVMCSLTIFLLPLILCYIGLDFLSWVSVYPLFDIARILEMGVLISVVPMFFGAVMGFGIYMLCCRMIDKYCWNFTDL